MANVDVAPSLNTPPASAGAQASLLVALSPTPPDSLSSTISNLRAAFAGESIVVTSPDIEAPDSSAGPGLLLLPRGEGVPMHGSWLLTPLEFVSAYRQAAAHGATACLLLGPESQSLDPGVIRSLAAAVLHENADLCTPDYALGAREGLVNSALLYPLSRALYNAQPRFPLAVDLALSLRLAERLANASQRSSTAEDDALVWPVAEAATTGMRIAQVPGGHRTLPPPDSTDLNALLARIVASLFADIEAHAAFWQRSRPAVQPLLDDRNPIGSGEDGADVQSLIDSFRVAYTNLADIWSLVLPPQSLLGLKKLSIMNASTFRMPPALWARVVYDFVLAFRLRTLNRGHLLGALTPLYLAWVASHVLTAESGASPDHHVEETALAFETEKPYFVSRWRWPDRFNP